MSESETPPAARPERPDRLSLVDLRDLARLRQDLTRLEGENRFMREQLGHALSGWRDEQRRTKALEQHLQALPAPAPDPAPDPDAREDAGEAGPPPPPPPPPERPPADPPGFWVRLWQGLQD